MVTLSLDPQIAAAIAQQVEQSHSMGIEFTMPARGDALGLRALVDPSIAPAAARADPAPEVTYTAYTVAADDGTPIDLRWYTKAGATTRAGVVYVHGGGMIMGSVEAYDPVVRQYVQWTGVPQLAVEYRVAPEVRGETPARDVLAATRWLHENAVKLAVDTSRVAIMGDSGGGGIAAGAAILARDYRLPLAKQILIYPMLDDRNTVPDPLMTPYDWTWDNNYTGWYALLGDEIGTDTVSPVAAPARLRDFSGLAPAYLEVGTLDIFRDETIAYARGLLKAGIDVDLHVHSGCPHGHDWLGFGTPWKHRWKADRVRALTSF